MHNRHAWSQWWEITFRLHSDWLIFVNPHLPYAKEYFISQITIFKHLHQIKCYKMHLSLFCICLQLYLPRPRGWSPIAFNKYRIIFWMFVCIIVLVACHATRICHIILADYTIYSTLSHKQRGFLEEVIDLKSVFWFSLLILSQTFLILRRTQRDMITNVHRSSCTVPLLLSYRNKSWILSTDFPKILKYYI